MPSFKLMDDFFFFKKNWIWGSAYFTLKKSEKDDVSL